MAEIPGLLGPAKGYTDMLDEHLLARQEAELAAPLTRNPLRPSAAGFCARKLAYEYHEFKGGGPYPREVKKPSVIRLLGFGSSVEYNVLRMFRDVELFQVKYTQQALSFFPLHDGTLIEGSIDFVLYSPEHKAVGDVKSKGDRFSSYTDSKWSEMDETLRKMQTVQSISETAYWIADLPAFLKELKDPFLKDNFIQVNAYACNPFLKERGVDHAFLYQYSKNDSRHRELRWKPSEEVAQYVKDKFQAISVAVDRDNNPELIPKEYGLGSMRCAYCEKNKLCWPLADAKKEFFANWPEKVWPRDTHRLGPAGEQLEQLKSLYDQAERVASNREELEQEICNVLEAEKVRKVRFNDGSIYELKFLKSPRPHLELRRAKL